MLNVTVILDLRQPNTVSGTNAGTLFTKHWMNVVQFPRSGSDIAMMFT